MSVETQHLARVVRALLNGYQHPWHDEGFLRDMLGFLLQQKAITIRQKDRIREIVERVNQREER